MKKRIILIFSVVSIFFLTVSCLSEKNDAHAPAVNQADYTDPAVLKNLVESGSTDYLLIDVRTPEEYASGHIPTAVNIPYDVITGNLLNRRLTCRSSCTAGAATGPVLPTRRSPVWGSPTYMISAEFPAGPAI